MTRFLAHLVVTALLLMFVGQLVPGVSIDGFFAAVIAALVLGFVNGFVRPLMIILTLPVTLLSFGLFLFVVNALMFWLVAALVPGVGVNGFGSALVGSVLLTILNLVVGSLVARSRRE